MHVSALPIDVNQFKNSMITRYTLENYFRIHEGKAIDFHLRVQNQGGEYSFYIHPANINGETWAFNVNGNGLERIPPGDGVWEENQRLTSRIEQLEIKVRDLEEFQRNYENWQEHQRDRGE